jgi:hypothetical protein
MPSALEHELRTATAREWESALQRLAPHKLYPILAFQLAQRGLLAHVPKASRELLERTHAEVRTVNMALVLTTATMLRALQRQGLEVLLMKGIVFADGFYPDPSTRPMGDIDIVATPDQDEAVLSVLSGLGFRPSDKPSQSDALVLCAPNGIVCDVHRRLRMFEHQRWEAITQRVELRHLHGVGVRCFEPNAMVAHLANHMTGHLRHMGPVLLWVLDLALVFRRHGAELSVERVRHLLSCDASWGVLLRMLALLDSLGEPLPYGFRAWLDVPPLSLPEIMRQRRIVPWGLPAPVGFLRLLAQRLSLRHYERRLSPEPLDLLLWPMDAASAHLTQRRVRRDPG